MRLFLRGLQKRDVMFNSKRDLTIENVKKVLLSEAMLRCQLNTEIQDYIFLIAEDMITLIFTENMEAE